MIGDGLRARLAPLGGTIAVLGGASLVACSLVVGSGDQCASDDVCKARLGALAVCVDNACRLPLSTADAASTADADAGPVDPVWGCVGSAQAVPTDATPVRFYARFRSSSGAPLAGLTVNPCAQLDFKCDQPSGGSTTNTDGDGLLDIMLTNGFRGYLDIRPDASHPALAPSIVYVQPIPDKRIPASAAGPDNPRHPTILLDTADLDRFATAVGATLNPEAGHVMFTAIDCQNATAESTTSGSNLVVADTTSFYLDPSGNATRALAATSSAGRGGLFNLPTGSVSITLSRAGGDRVALENILVRKGAVTHLVLSPR